MIRLSLPQGRTPATGVIVGTLVAVHAATAVWAARLMSVPLWEALVLPRSPRVRILVGGQYGPLLDQGETWRLATSAMLHVDLVHLSVNVAALWVLGRLLEPLVGTARWGAWFCLGAVGGSLASWGAGVAQSDGASGGAFALLAAAVAIGFRHRARLGREDARLLGPIFGALLAVNVVLGFVIPALDASAHMGGLVVGVLVGLAWSPSRPDAGLLRGVHGVVVLAFTLTCLLGWRG